jgi:hypothetical protein
MKEYVRSVLTSLNVINDDALHCGSYYDINVQNIEFGDVLKWKHKNKKAEKVEQLGKCLLFSAAR